MTAPVSFTMPGGSIPAIGFGTSPMTGGMSAETVLTALKAGYRHIDTGRKYGTEGAVGEAIRLSGLPRDDVFVVTKVSHENLRAADFARSVEQSLEALKLDYVDLLMIHWPNPQIPLSDAMPSLAKAKREGLARRIGVANFNTTLLDEAVKLSSEPLSVLQAEYHPYLDQTKLLAAVRRHGLAFVAHCPLARGRMFEDQVLGDIAKAHGRGIAQVALRWLIQQNVVPIPFSSKPERIAENFDVFGFTLSDDEMARIAALKRSDGRIANPVERVSGGWD
ncbi:MAG: aldo/keto reductase [Pseudolabrys sp.]|nr:aldo/keto reductase [Pseudolabrys sp.]